MQIHCVNVLGIPTRVIVVTKKHSLDVYDTWTLLHVLFSCWCYGDWQHTVEYLSFLQGRQPFWHIVCVFLCMCVCTSNPIWKCLLQKNENLSQSEWNLSLGSRTFLTRKKKYLERVASPAKVFIPLQLV